MYTISLLRCYVQVASKLVHDRGRSQCQEDTVGIQPIGGRLRRKLTKRLSVVLAFLHPLAR